MKSKKARRSARVRQQRSVTILLISLAGILLILAGIFIASRRGTPASFEPEVTGSPRLKADQQKVDLGDVRLGDWVEVSFDLTNVGDERLHFTRQPYVEVVEGC